jgi:hypothetical protein
MPFRPRLPWQNLLSAILPLLFAGGCIAVPVTQPWAPHKLPPGSTYLMHVPGISGMLVVDAWLVRGLHDGGAADVTEVFDWVGPGNVIQILQDIDHNRQTARRMAPFLAEVRKLNPDSKIILCSESGGVAVALWLLEALPPDVAVDDFLMVSPAVSPGYDLSAALSHVRHRAYYTTTPIDVDTLGLFTLLFGNGDGPRGVGAGWVGFDPPRMTNARAYENLVRVPYQPQWIIRGNFGTHTGPMSYQFAKNVLAPMVKSRGGPVATTQRPSPTPRSASPLQ